MIPRKLTPWRTAACSAIIAAGLAQVTLGNWMMPTDMPVERVISNATKYTQEHPNDASGYYVLGRAHALAYTLKSREISIWERQQTVPGLPEVAPDNFQTASWKDRGADPPPTRDELLGHLKGAIDGFIKSLWLGGNLPERHLSFAHVLDTGSSDAAEVTTVPIIHPLALTEQQRKSLEALIANLADKDAAIRDDAKKQLAAELNLAAPLLHNHRAAENPNAREAIRDLLRQFWQEQSIAEYLIAYKGAIKKDLTITRQPMSGLHTLVAYEAGKSYIRLVKARAPKDKTEQDTLAAVEKDMKSLDDKPPNNAVTPIILAIDRPTELPDLLSKDTACFDLAGTGRVQAWPWVRPETGILVWDPEGKNNITSGRQLFGSATWWMLFSDGYHALDALDDNRDGWLSGDELRGLAVWFDVNGNGVSDPGEVFPVEKLGIAAIATQSTSMEGLAPANRAGLLMRDGRILPTYDWVVFPAQPEPDPCSPAPQTQ